MSWGSWLLWGFAATVVLTTLMAGSQALGFTRMNLPYLLGTLVTADRDRARVVGILIHIFNGWVFSLLYLLAFRLLGVASAPLGALIGLVHAAFVLMVGLPALPGMHPRMMSERNASTRVQQLEPPGFLGLHYGIRTPISVLLSHLVFGAILGTFLRI
jgi:hypothetical protein